MRAGDMRDRVVIQRVTETRDSFGHPIKSYSELDTVWAAVRWDVGNESFQGEREWPEVPASVSLRRSRDTMSVREKDRLLVPQGATKLRQMISSTATSIVLDYPGVMPPENEFCVRVGTELMLVSAGAGTTASPYTVSRAVYGTTAKAHVSGASVLHMVPLDVVSVTHTRDSMELAAVRDKVRTTT